MLKAPQGFVAYLATHQPEPFQLRQLRQVLQASIADARAGHIKLTLRTRHVVIELHDGNNLPAEPASNILTYRQTRVMGYDCTLHVVDEQRIRAEFVPKLLGQSQIKTPFDNRSDAADLWQEVREAISDAGVDAEVAASQVCQLAVAFCAAELPYHYERGFCLSLWPDQPDELEATVPKKLRGDPEPLFAQITAAHPRLRGKFSTEFDGNFSTGVFVPADKVAGLLKWAERRVKGYSKPKQRLFRGLLLVLNYAAEHGLAYWEGTDLQVDMNAKAPGATERPRGLEEFAGPKDFHLEFIAQCGATVVHAHGIGTRDCRTVFADFRDLPPMFAFADECSLAAGRSPGGRWLTLSMTSDEPFVYHVRTSDSPTGKRAILAAPKQKKGRIQWAGFLGERIVAVMAIAGKDALAANAAYTLIEQDGRLVRIKELRERTNARHNHGLIRLNGGDEFFVWDGDAYEWRDGHFELALALGAKSYGSALLCSAPFREDRFFYLSESRLFSAGRGQTPAAHLPRFDNIMSVFPGPTESLLLKEGDNKLGDLGKLYFPDEDIYIRIEPEWFPDEDPDDINTLLWIPDCQRVVAATSERFWAVPAEIALSHPRHRASSGRKAGK